MGDLKTDGVVVMLAGPATSTNVTYNALSSSVGLAAVLMETRTNSRTLLRRRAARLGVGRVVGQLLFRAAVTPLLSQMSTARIREIQASFDLDVSPIPSDVLREIPSVNSAETVSLLERLGPRVVVVKGTRLIRPAVLRAFPDTVFLNLHAGITPRYRGVHGGYWALAQNDPSHCGVTVHVVDAGLDTGRIIAQALIAPTMADNFVTYPWLQLGVGVPLLISAVRAASSGRLETFASVDGPSTAWSHPTALEYFRNRLRGVR
jgi:folate-dependent phosphoribosylglycinamide formyltransferase PurN